MHVDTDHVGVLIIERVQLDDGKDRRRVIVGDLGGGAAQRDPQRRAELSLEVVEIVEVVHTINPFSFVNARRRSERTVLAGRPKSDRDVSQREVLVEPQHDDRPLGGAALGRTPHLVHIGLVDRTGDAGRGRAAGRTDGESRSPR